MIALGNFFPSGLPTRDATPRLMPGAIGSGHGLLDWPDIGRILAEDCFDGQGSAAIADALKLDSGPSRVCLIRDGAEIWRVPRLVNVPEFVARLPGSTLRIEAIEEVHPPLRPFAEQLRQAAPAVYCNAYAAWGTEPGLGIHYDYTDILVLQLRGEKHWRIFRPTHEAVRGLKSAAYKHALQQAERGVGGDPAALGQVYAGLFWEGILGSGDALYVPPGWFHSVRPIGGPTLHLSCAFRAPAAPGGGAPDVRLPDMLRSTPA